MARLVLFTNHYPYPGGEEFLEAEIKYLAEAFTDIHIIPLSGTLNSTLRPVPINVKIHKHLIKFEIYQKKKLFIKGLFNTAPFWFVVQEFFRERVFFSKMKLRNFLSFTSIIRTALASSSFKSLLSMLNEKDTLYFYWGDNASLLLPFINKHIKARSFVRFHGTDLYEENKGGFLPYRSLTLPSIDTAIFISAHGMKYFKERYKGFDVALELSRLGTIGGTVNPKAIQGEAFHIVTCASVVPVKRLHLIPLALRLIKQPIHWTHIGKGPLIDNLIEKSKNLPPHIEASFMGYVQNEDIMKFYSTHHVDALVNVSSNEGIPVSIMEAYSAGIPAIAPAVGGIPEIVDNTNGVLIDKDITPEQLAHIIESFLLKVREGQYAEKAQATWKEKYNAENNYLHLTQILQSTIL